MPSWTREPTPTTQTRIHKRLHDTLWELGFDVADEVKVGRYYIDCFITELWMGFEADGQLYHKGKDHQRDLVRDAMIYEEFGIPILRIPDYDLKRVSDPETVKLIEGFINQHGHDIKERREIASVNGHDIEYQ